MSAGALDILIEQGATFELDMTLTDENGDRIDLTGHTFRGQVRASFSDSAIVATMSFTPGDQTQPATKGTVKATISAANTTTIPVPANTDSPERPITKMIYDIESEVAGTVYRWLQGAAMISPEVTR